MASRPRHELNAVCKQDIIVLVIISLLSVDDVDAEDTLLFNPSRNVCNVCQTCFNTILNNIVKNLTIITYSYKFYSSMHRNSSHLDEERLSAEVYD